MTLQTAGALAVLGGLLWTGPAAAQSCAPEGIGLQEAVERAAGADLRPDAVEAAIAAARAERAIASFGPQDSFELSTENFPGFGTGDEFENLNVTGRYTRVWERGGKREARLTLADAGVDVAAADLAVVRAEIGYEIESLFASLWGAEMRLALAEERLAAAREVQALIARRVSAARDPELAALRAATDVSLAESLIVELRLELDAVSAAIAAFWGEESGDFETCSLIPAAPSAGAAPAQVSPPELQRYEAMAQESRARLRLAETEAVPDITWGVGVRSFGFDEDVALVGSVSVPLGAPPRSSARAARDRAEQARIDAEARALVQDARRQSRVMRQRSDTALATLRELDGRPIAEAREALEQAVQGYQRGAFSYLDVIEARRTLFDLRERRIDLLETHLQAKASLARLGAEDRPWTVQESSR